MRRINLVRNCGISPNPYAYRRISLVFSVARKTCCPTGFCIGSYLTHSAIKSSRAFLASRENPSDKRWRASLLPCCVSRFCSFCTIKERPMQLEWQLPDSSLTSQDAMRTEINDDHHRNSKRKRDSCKNGNCCSLNFISDTKSFPLHWRAPILEFASQRVWIMVI